jgi:hypothetical protein
MLQYLPWVLLMALTTAIVYAWGLSKKQNQSRDLMAILYDKCSAKVIKALKKNGSMTKDQLEDLLDHTTASLFYSRNRVAVQDPEQFTKSLLQMMEEHHMIRQGTGEDSGKYLLYHKK